MDITQQGSVILLKSAITGEKLTLPEGFNIEEAFELIKAHHAMPLLYAGAVNCGIAADHPVMRQMFQLYCKALQRSERQMREIKRVFKAFDENGIDYLPLKGCIMKGLYPLPELRTMGDADVLIRTDQYEHISEVMRELGFQESNETFIHYSWHSDLLYLELHKLLFKPENKVCNEYFKNGWVHAIVDSGTRYKMSVENTFVFLFTHFYKHFSAAGIGCRHVVDLWVYLRNHAEMDEVYLEKVFEQLKLREFYHNILRLIDVWFENGEIDDKTEIISQMIFKNGSWGSYLNEALNKGAREMGGYSSVVMSRIKYILHLIFPPIIQLKGSYPTMKKYPLLIPVMWFMRLVKKLASIKRLFIKHRNGVGMLDKDKLENQKQLMRYIGLGMDD